MDELAVIPIVVIELTKQGDDNGSANLTIGLRGNVIVSEQDISISGVEDVPTAEEYAGLLLWHLGQVLQNAKAAQVGKTTISGRLDALVSLKMVAANLTAPPARFEVAADVSVNGTNNIRDARGRALDIALGVGQLLSAQYLPALGAFRKTQATEHHPKWVQAALLTKRPGA